MMTPKQALFIAEYLVDGNATRAAMAAGFAAKSAGVTGAKLLKNAQVAAVIAQRRAQRVERLDADGERLDRELLSIAYADIGRFYDADGNRIPVHLLDEDLRRAINLVEDETRDGKRTQRVKLCDKLRAIELTYKRRGLLTEQVNHSGRVTLEELVCGETETA